MTREVDLGSGDHGQTLLSDLIIENMTGEQYARFLDRFRRSLVGVIAHGIPDGLGPGDQVTSSASQPIELGTTEHFHGQRMTLAFADPDAFVEAFGQEFNATMRGSDLLEATVDGPGGLGILVNSARSDISVVIKRETILELVGRRPDRQEPRKPRWKSW